MKKLLSPDLTFYFDRSFPSSPHEGSTKTHRITLGIGGNIGNTRKRFEKLLLYLRSRHVIDVLHTSPILKNPPFGFLDQAPFYNAVLICKTDLSPRALLKYILRTERLFKRSRSFKNSPRTLDIDILFYDRIALNHKDLVIPHPYCHVRESVMIPLAYLVKRVQK